MVPGGMFSTEHHSLFTACEEFRNPGMCYVVEFMPYLFSLFRSWLWGTVSNAFEKSIMIMSTCDLLFRDLDRSCVVSIKWVSVEGLLRKPCCLSDKTEFWSRWSTCSRSLQHTEVREMGR